jgi:hypothetical protein
MSLSAPSPGRKNVPATAKGTALKPLKEKLSKSALIAHLFSHNGVETRSVKAVLASLEATIAAALHKNGARLFTCFVRPPSSARCKAACCCSS